MLRKKMYQILEAVCNAPTIPDKIRVLQAHDHKALRGYLKMAFDKNLRWMLPEGTPPFKPCEEVDVDHVPYNEFRRMYIFLPGGNPNLADKRRQELFVNLLESMDPKDAAFICKFVKDHNIPEGIDEGIVKQAYGANW